MSRLPDYDRGFRDAAKLAVTLLHDEARQMNDPKARDILNSAGFNLGVYFKYHPPQAGGRSPRTALGVDPTPHDDVSKQDDR